MSSSDFALAQQRIALRRQAREAEAQARFAAQRANSSVRKRLAQLPYPLDRLGGVGVSTWETIKGRDGTRPAFRVGQVDAELLDEELLELLRGQVGDALKYFGTHVLDDWSEEIMLALRAILFKLTVWDHGKKTSFHKRMTAANKGHRCDLWSSVTKPQIYRCTQ